MKADRKISEFINDRARQRFHIGYRAALARLWPETVTATPVPTRYGEAVAYRAGAAHGTPVVLVPGAGGNALSWYQYVAPLGRHHPVIALDPVGEPGAARQTRPITTPGDVAACLADTLAGLDLPDAHLVGMSYGAWAVVRHELDYPRRAASLTLLDPGGFGRLGARFWAWVIAGGLAGVTPAPLRHRLAGPARNATLRNDDLMPLFPLTLRFRRRLPVPPPLTAGELARITAPTLILLGEHSVLYPATTLARQLTDTLPSATVEVVPGASHDLPAHSPDLVAARIGQFLTP